ncbi:hypothetical protein PCANC_06703 [Puccinia coronata f. sp. avenae]|uniref:Uncharacterized protein n=1 Tax=Puccinia coronata f. sp. avenae TaxID=200324 RepID=A0A2N5VUE2_9BASI|nr:hypothetical protein PCANC_06703 [Puccinia coronata f. sp. avenae]
MALTNPLRVPAIRWRVPAKGRRVPAGVHAAQDLQTGFPSTTYHIPHIPLPQPYAATPKMAQTRKQPQQRSEDGTDRPTSHSNNKDDYHKEEHEQDLDSASANVTTKPETTNEKRLEDAHDLIPSFESSGNHDMKSDDEEDTNHLPDFTNGELGEDDELTLADLEDIEPESVDDKYTLESCRQSLAKQTNSTSHQTQRQSS